MSSLILSHLIQRSHLQSNTVTFLFLYFLLMFLISYWLLNQNFQNFNFEVSVFNRCFLSVTHQNMLMRLARHKPKEIIYYRIRGWISAASLRGKVCNWINLWIACLHSCVNTKTSHMESSPGTGPVNMWCLQTHCVIFTHRTMLWLRNLKNIYKMQNYYYSNIGNIQIQLCDVFVWINRRTWMKKKNAHFHYSCGHFRCAIWDLKPLCMLPCKNLWERD